MMKPAATEKFLYQSQPAQPDAVRVGWVYPYTYPVSMSSLGYLTLFRQLDERPDVSVRRINTDNMQAESVRDLEMMGVSFSFELDILEIIRILQHYQLPLFARDRDSSMPLLFAGGPVVMTNPEPYADFFDFFLIGEGEEVLADLITAYQKHRHLSNRSELLKILAEEVPGLYVPSLYDVSYAEEITGITPEVKIEKRWMENMDEVIASTPILTENSVFSNTFLVEVMRGCAHRCRFCLASYSMLPARGPSLESIIEKIELGLIHTDKIGLLGALIADHPQFEELCTYLQGKKDAKVTAASLRADTLTPHIAKTLKQGGQQTVTIAVETGSEKLRKRINKHLKTEDILQAADITAHAGLATLKLYMMVGLPEETDQDLEDTVNLVKTIKKQNPQQKIAFGCSTFVPKAQTPFQWMPRESSKVLQEKHAYLRKQLYKYCDFRPSSPKWDSVQALLSMGDRRLAPWIVEFVNQGANLGAVNRTFKKIQVPSLAWYTERQRESSEILPWERISLGVSKETLYKESGL